MDATTNTGKAHFGLRIVSVTLAISFAFIVATAKPSLACSIRPPEKHYLFFEKPEQTPVPTAAFIGTVSSIETQPYDKTTDSDLRFYDGSEKEPGGETVSLTIAVDVDVMDNLPETLSLRYVHDPSVNAGPSNQKLLEGYSHIDFEQDHRVAQIFYEDETTFNMPTSSYTTCGGFDTGNTVTEVEEFAAGYPDNVAKLKRENHWANYGPAYLALAATTFVVLLTALVLRRRSKKRKKTESTRQSDDA